jgi:hypothetical protein
MVFLNNVIFFCSKKRYSSQMALFFLVVRLWMEKGPRLRMPRAAAEQSVT